MDIFEIKKEEINIQFISIIQKIKFSITSNNTVIFNDIKQKLFIAFPELKNFHFNCIFNGNVLAGFEEYCTLVQNGIKDGNIILINLENEKEDIF